MVIAKQTLKSLGRIPDAVYGCLPCLPEQDAESKCKCFILMRMPLYATRYAHHDVEFCLYLLVASSTPEVSNRTSNVEIDLLGGGGYGKDQRQSHQAKIMLRTKHTKCHWAMLHF